MITGFNTDIEHNGVIYHVQTEDKGLESPLILSLVYNRGTILASKRSPYNDLLIGNFNSKELEERLQRQHKLICAAIRAGRIEDLKKMNTKAASTLKNAAAPEKIAELSKAQVSADADKRSKSDLQHPPEKVTQWTKGAQSPPITSEQPKNQSIEPVEFYGAPIELTDADLIFDEVTNSEEIVMIPEEAVEVITYFSEQGAAQKVENLQIELLQDVVFRSGQNNTASVMVRFGKEKKPIAGGDLQVKIIGSNFRPLVLSTKTDSNGVATVNLQIPVFTRGRAAILFKATKNGEEAELRRIVRPN